ncbi:glycosyltransferase family 2 protein [Winogradskyella forsetii]|uniref:glycosyltransferase family 2 protein n=1 Tax=Winogradskyella forsetii TaxID=2686077 RepID=UPI0015B8AD6E|nr:glycosyltransferase family 2 protein [Winogradskyella forsetii]
MQPLVSIILPNYNHSDYLQDRLASIYNQTYQNFKVVILDDCSKDHSLTILDKYKNHPKTSHFIINKENSGSPFKQWQKGLELATGDFVWIAESDDYCDLNFLESQIQQINHQNLDIVVAETKTVHNKLITGRTQHPVFKDANALEITLNSFLYCPILNVSAVLFKKELIRDISQFYNYKIIGDRVFYFEAFQNKKVAINRHTQSYFRKEGDSVSALSSKGLDYFVDYYREHYRFAYDAYNAKKIDKKLYQSYIKRFFNRVNSRLSKAEKLQSKYLKLRLSYYIDLKK